MAFENISTSAAIWKDLGITQLLLSKDAFSSYTLQKTPPALASALAPASRQASQPKNGTCESKLDFHPWSMPSSSPPESKKQQAPLPSIPYSEWPPIWQEQLQRTKKGTIAWTYWQLGSDFLASRTNNAPNAPHKQRGQIMRRLLGKLGHPAGTHTFWPLHLDDVQEPSPQPALFWSGMRSLGCRGLIIFGSDGARKLFPERKIGPMMSLRLGGYFVWVIKDIDCIENDPAFYQRMVIYLKQNLAHFARC